MREEALKAPLILSRSGWRVRIHTAEAHGYFEGQLEFLSKFSGVLDRWLSDKSIGWSDSEDAEYQSKFSDYCAKASAVFSANGLNDFGAHRWERALLTKGDYLLQRGINRSFLDNSGRDGGWKRLLRGSLAAISLSVRGLTALLVARYRRARQDPRPSCARWPAMSSTRGSSA